MRGLVLMLGQVLGLALALAGLYGLVGLFWAMLATGLLLCTVCTLGELEELRRAVAARRAE
jgi:hypothetical protein